MKVVFVDENNQEMGVDLPAHASCLELAHILQHPNLSSPYAAEINGTLKEMPSPLQEGDRVQFITFDSLRGKALLWHTTMHVLAEAVLRLFPDAIPICGATDDYGFYYDFSHVSIAKSCLPRIEEEMTLICSETPQPELYAFATKQEALSYFQGNRYKTKLIKGMNGSIKTYRRGEYIDLCSLPHLPELHHIKIVCLQEAQEGYWSGTKGWLCRISGISFPEKKFFDDYIQHQKKFQEERQLKKTEAIEAKKHDHKILGPKLGLFSFHEEAPGIPFLHPKGLIVWNRLLDYWRQCHQHAGYLEIKTPTLLTKELLERSGHWPHDKEDMCSTVQEGRRFVAKSTNCPGAILFYKEKNHSYRELPLRIAEIGSVLHRLPGRSLGLFSHHGAHIDESHIFMKREDVNDELLRIFKLTNEIYGTFGFSIDGAHLSTTPYQQAIGSQVAWKASIAILQQALKATGKPFTEREGGAAFYGPQITLRVQDALGHARWCTTIQLDMTMPVCFDLEYTAQDGTKKRPIIMHRSIFGSIESFFGFLMELFMGKFPLWLSPNAVQIIAIAERHAPYAQKVQEVIAAHDFMVDTDLSSTSVSKKVRHAQLAQYNYILSIGDREIETKTISLRTRDTIVHGNMTLDRFLESICKERNTKALTSPFSSQRQL